MIGLLASLLVAASPAPGILPDDPGSWTRHPVSETAVLVTSMAIGDAGAAAGLSQGGVVVVDPLRGRRFAIQGAAFGPKGRILSLAWTGPDLWIASEAGLHRQRTVVSAVGTVAPVPPLLTGARAVLAQGGALWCATTTALLEISPLTGEVRREWKFPQEIEPTSLLRVAGRTFVGTAAAGLFVHDSATLAWSRFSRAEGLSDDQVTGLEWSGGEVFVATSEGVDVFDLSTQKVRPLPEAPGTFWLAQVNGHLLSTGADGLEVADLERRGFRRVALPAGVAADGALAVDQGFLAVGAGREILVRPLGGILSDEPPRLDPEGFRIRVARQVPQGMSLKAWMRLPEWPASRMELKVQPAESLSYVVYTPSDVLGGILIDLEVVGPKSVLEVRSLAGVGDRRRPVLDMAAPPTVVRGTELVVAGAASGTAPLKLAVQPEGREWTIGADGRFRGSVTLRKGANRFAVTLSDGLGLTTHRAWTVVSDDAPPEVDPVSVDTVAGDFARLRLRVRDVTAVKASSTWAGPLVVDVLDSNIVVEAGGLAVGENRIPLVVVDQAGNRSSTELRVHRRDPVRAFDATAGSADQILSTQPGWTGTGGRGVTLVRYRAIEGETLQDVSERFYGVRPLSAILGRWNGVPDSLQGRKLTAGTAVDVPFWTDFEFGRMDLREATTSFPWTSAPSRAKGRK